MLQNLTFVLNNQEDKRKCNLCFLEIYIELRLDMG